MGLCALAASNCPGLLNAKIASQKRKIEVTEDAVKEWEWRKQVRKEVRSKKRFRESGTAGSAQQDTQPSEYHPTQVLPGPISNRRKSRAQSAKYTGDTVDTLPLRRAYRFLHIEKKEGFLVTVNKPFGFDRDQYTIYTDSDAISEGACPHIGPQTCGEVSSRQGLVVERRIISVAAEEPHNKDIRRSEKPQNPFEGDQDTGKELSVQPYPQPQPITEIPESASRDLGVLGTGSNQYSVELQTIA